MASKVEYPLHLKVIVNNKFTEQVAYVTA